METTQTTQNEIAVIGSLLLSSDSLPIIEESGLTPQDFQTPICETIFSAALESRNNGKPLDMVFLGSVVREQTGQDVSTWMHGAMECAPAAANLPLCCELVKKESKRRRIQELLSEASYNAVTGDWSSTVDKIIREFTEIRSEFSSDLSTGARLAKDFLEYYERVKSNPGTAFCRTGYDELDWQFGGGMFRSEVYIIGARPGMGKTTLGINIAENVARHGDPVLFVSLEMTENQIMAKRIALEGGLQYTQVMSGALQPDEEQKMRDTVKRLVSRPFFLTTKSGLTIGEINKTARQIQDLRLIVVDYLGLIPAAAESASKPRYEQMTEISAGIKALAKALDVPILALSQLNRENMTRKDKRPTLADLRDSGAIEQDAGAVVLLHRPEYYENREQGDSADTEDIELNVAKNRHHAPGLVHMTWNGSLGAIRSKSERPSRVSAEEELPF